MDALDDITRRIEEIAKQIEAYEAAIGTLEAEAEALEDARETLQKYLVKTKGSEESDDDVDALGLTKKQRLVYLAVPIGKLHRKKPAAIIASCPRLDPGYVRTTLWRLADHETISSQDGFYWRNSL